MGAEADSDAVAAFVDSYEDELKSFVGAVADAEAEKVAAAAAALFTKFISGSSVAAASAEKLAAKVFGQWLADNPDARLNAAATAYTRADRKRAVLHEVAAVVQAPLRSLESALATTRTDAKTHYDDLEDLLGQCLRAVSHLGMEIGGGRAELLERVDRIEAALETSSRAAGVAQRPASPNSGRQLVFVSYSHIDKAWLERLRVFLKPWMRHGLQYWADDYIQVGDRWERAIDDSIGRARAAVLLLSPHFFASDFIHERELPPLREAADSGQLTLFCIPVSASAYRAAGLSTYQFPHAPTRPLDGLPEHEQNSALVTIAEQIAQVVGVAEASSAAIVQVRRTAAPVTISETGRLGTLHEVPDLPRHHLPRTNEVEAVKRLLLAGEDTAVGISASRSRMSVGVEGLGGIGKTVLAQAVVRDEEVRRAFPDGVHWINLGQAPDLARLQSRVALGLGHTEANFTNPTVGSQRLRELLVDKACLIVLDDVWEPEHVVAFGVLGSRGRLLLTTRDAQLVRVVGATPLRLDVLDTETALRLLASWTGTEPQSLPNEAADVAEQCGYLPLALSLAAAQVVDGLSFRDLRDALIEGRIQYLDHPYGSVFASLGLSVSALKPQESARYRELAIVPEDTGMPASVVARLWTHTGGLRSFEANQLMVRLANKNLLYLHGTDPQRSVRFHDLQLDYLRLLEAERLHAHHERVLSAFTKELPERPDGFPYWSQLPTSETYLWQHLGSHLRAANRSDELQRLVQDVGWLEAKLAISGVSGLLVELAQIAHSLPNEACIRIERALRLESGWLQRAPDSLQSLLYNRLRSQNLDRAHIAQLVPGLNAAVRLRHPVRMDRGELHVFRGHSTLVSACVYSPDGSRVLSASHDNTVREWDARSGAELQRFEGHTKPVTSCSYHPDGSRVLSASHDNTVREWDTRTGAELRRFKGHSDWVMACTYSPDGSRVLSASFDNTVREWDAGSGVELQRFKGHASLVNACAYSPDGTRIASASDDRTVREWDARTGNEIQRLKGHANFVTACVYSPDGTRLLSASYDATLREWDARTGAELQLFQGHSGFVNGCAYSPDGSRVLSASHDNTVREWDARNGTELQRFEGHSKAVTACAYSPDGLRISSASDDNTVREWDAQSGVELHRFEGHSDWVTACAYSRDAKRILSASFDRTVREWDAGTGIEVRRFQGHANFVNACAYSPDGKRALSGSHDTTLREWDARTGAELRRFEGHASFVTACVYSRDGARVLSASHDTTVREWDVRRAAELRRFEGHAGFVTACAYSRDGTRVLSASHDATVREWDARTGVELRRFEGHSDWVTACAYSADGKRVLSASHDTTLKIWSAIDGSALHTVYGTAPFNCLTVAHGEIVAGDTAGNLWILEWEAE